jgi:hypothetical protein
MSNNEKNETALFAPKEIHVEYSELHQVLYAPFFLEKDRRARERMKKSPIPEEFRFNKKK